MKDGKSLNRNVTETLVVYGINAVFNKNGIHLKGEHGEMYGRISRHRSERKTRPAGYCNINISICRMTSIGTLMREDMNG